MSPTLTLVDGLALRDLQVYLSRASRIEEGSVRLIAGGGILAVYVAVIYPAGLLDEVPTVLGLRTFALTDTTPVDAVVPIRSLLERVNRLDAEMTQAAAPVTMTVPMGVNTVTWAAISPPKGGWLPRSSTTTGILNQVARAGIAEVADAVPTGTGAQLVQKVRAEVWGRDINGLEDVAAGGAFAALSLGFLSDNEADEVRIFDSGPWTRLTSPRGHVLIKRKAWRLAR
ncbi:MAG: hypothetical protein QOD50_872 [Actinomycetota bacterium]|jgi:hypothetical protein|nr:hypothetical protein [Actinomycetota bacterium]